MKKYFFVATSILMIIITLFEFSQAPEIAQNTIEAMEETQEIMNETMSEMMEQMKDSMGEEAELLEETYLVEPSSTLSSIITPQYIMRVLYVTGFLTIIFSLHTIEIAMNGHILRRRKRIVVYSVIMMLMLINIFISLLALMNFIVVLVLKRKDEEDYPVKPAPVVPLEEPDHSKKAIIKGVLTILLYILFHFGFDIAVGLINKELLDATWYQCVSLGLDVVLFIILILMHKAELKAGLNALKENKAGYKRTIVRRTLIGFLCVAILNGLRIIITGESFSNNQDLLNGMPLIETAILAIIWAPIVEELVFRSAIRSFLKNKIAFIIIAATIFGTLHAISEDGVFNIIITALPYIALGACLSCGYAKTNNIWVNMCMHALNNAVGVIAMYMLFGM